MKNKFKIYLAMLSLTAVSSPAVAVDISDTVLGAAASDIYFGLKVQDNVRTSKSGSLDISGTAGCASKCVATSGLGASPFVDLYASQVYDPYVGGGFARIVLQYFVQYNNAADSSPYDVTLKSSDILDIAPGSYGQTNLAFGPAFDRYGSYTFGSLLLNATHCAGACSPVVGTGVDGGPIGSYSVSMLANTPYLVRLTAVISPNDDGSVSHAAIDPTFSTTATGGKFVFSPGVFAVAAVPEPATWAMALLGFGLIGFELRRRRNQVSVATHA